MNSGTLDRITAVYARVFAAAVAAGKADAVAKTSARQACDDLTEYVCELSVQISVTPPSPSPPPTRTL